MSVSYDFYKLMSVTVFHASLRCFSFLFFCLLLPLKLRCILALVMSLNNYQPGGILIMVVVDNADQAYLFTLPSPQ